MARRDIWLVRQSIWRVVARRGDAESGRVRHWDYETEADARQMVERLMAIESPGRWRAQAARTAPPVDNG
jgi:hypothetical protein